MVLGDGGDFNPDYCHHVTDCQSAFCKDSENNRQDGHGDASAISRDAGDSAFGQQASELEDFREVNQDYKIWQIRAGIWSSLVSPLTFLVVNTTLVCVIWQGQLNISAGLLTQGMLALWSIIYYKF